MHFETTVAFNYEYKVHKSHERSCGLLYTSSFVYDAMASCNIDFVPYNIEGQINH